MSKCKNGVRQESSNETRLRQLDKMAASLLQLIALKKLHR